MKRAAFVGAVFGAAVCLFGTAQAQTSPASPQVPTVSKAGLPGFEVSVWFSVLAPARTAREIVSRFNAILVKALQSTDVRERLASQGAEPIGNTPDQFPAVMKMDIEKWAKVVRDANIKLD